MKEIAFIEPLKGLKPLKGLNSDNRFKLIERAPEVTVDEIRKETEGWLTVEGEIPEMRF